MTDSFYDLEGNLVSRTKLRDKMIDYFRELLEDESTKITDFNEGSEIRNLMESIAVDLYHLEYITFESMRMAFLKYATGNWLDLHGEEMGLSRDYGNYSYGVLRFELPKPLGYPVVIPIGTYCVHKDTGAVYKTVLDGTIPTGATSVDVNAFSITQGKINNAEADTITLFQDSTPSPGMTVTNPIRFNGGRDVETDEEFRNRLLTYAKKDSFGSVSYYQAVALEIEGVHDIAFTSAPANTSYTATLLVNGDNKPTEDGIMSRAISTFTLQDNLVIGHNFYIAKPVYNNVELTIRVYVDENIEEVEFYKCLNALFDGGEYGGNDYMGLNIGDNLPKINIINALERITFVSQVDYVLLGENATTFDTIECDDGEVLKIDTSNLSITQVLTD